MSRDLVRIYSSYDFTGKNGKYEVNDFIGGGGFGIVLKGKAVAGKYKGEDVAIKVPNEFYKDHRSDLAIKYIQLEIQFLKEVTHPNIVRYLDDGVFKSGMPFLVMEYVRGEELYKIVKNHGRFDMDRAIKIVSLLADVVQTIHSCDYIHRDLNPRNVLLTADGGIKIIDFGTVKKGYAGIDKKYRGTHVSFPGFGDPLIATAGEAGIQSDIFTLGADLYYLLTGRPVYETCSSMETARKEIEKNLSIISDERIRKILEKALLTREYKSAIEFKNDLLGRSPPKPPIDYDAYLVFAGRKYYFKDSLIIGRLTVKPGIPHVALIYSNNTYETLCEDVGPYVSSYDPSRSKYGFARIYRSSGKWYVEKVSPHQNKLGVFKKREGKWYLLDQGMKIEIEDGDILGVPYNPTKGPYKEFIFGTR